MKKILLIALSLGMGSFAYAQTNISVNTLMQPTGTIYMGDGDPKTTIQVNVTNNTTTDYPAQTVVQFNVSLDGTPVLDPSGQSWIQLTSNVFLGGDNLDVTLTSDWMAQGEPGTQNLCIELTQILENFIPQLNQDANKELCTDVTFDFPAGVNDLGNTEISQVITNGDFLTVYVKNTNDNAQINIMSITGQVIKTVNTSVSGQNIYQDINISDVTPGLYIVTVQTENGTSAAKKVFIQ